jgi:hypothetical protein
MSTERYLESLSSASTSSSSACNSLEPPFLKTEDKIVLSPIVFQGKKGTANLVTTD